MLYEPIFKNDVRAEYIAVSDYFADQLIGGAELTLQALLEQTPQIVHRVNSDKVTTRFVFDNRDKHWIIGNYSNLSIDVVRAIIKNVKYSLIEFDYKFCSERSPKKHKSIQGKECDCQNSDLGKFIFHFMMNAHSLFWMSEAQKNVYTSRFPQLKSRINSVILSSVFDDKTLDKIEQLYKNRVVDNEKDLILKSNSWVKGTDRAVKYCTELNKEHVLLDKLSYDDMLNTLSRSQRLVYLPNGEDTCPRLVIEAVLLGLEIVVDNDNVQHLHEPWTKDRETTLTYLRQSAGRFWSIISDNNKLNSRSKSHLVSGYVTTYNCISQEYPVLRCIESLFDFCDEVCIVDGGSSDGTVDAITQKFCGFSGLNTDQGVINKNGDVFKNKNELVWVLNTLNGKTIKLRVNQVDWSGIDSALHDGMQKALARELCSGVFCWQMDVDEVTLPTDAIKVKDICMKMQLNTNSEDLLILPVVEFWGSIEKTRADVNPWKWRLSRNLWHITHGVPNALRVVDEHGILIASLPGSDGCDMIDKVFHEQISPITFYTREIDILRHRFLSGEQTSKNEYTVWLKNTIKSLPVVYHFSWVDIQRKIRLYRDFWTRHWSVLYDCEYSDTAESNKFFDCKWSEVTDVMIEERAKELSSKIGGWIFHQKWNGSCVPWVNTCDICDIVPNYK